MNIRHLKTLITVSEKGSFAAAAEAVCLTQSAVSQQMKALEHELGAELFDRTHRPPLLNARARGLIQRARQVVYLYEQLSDEASETSDLTGLLEIGAVHTALAKLLPRALVRLRAAQPTLQVRVSSGLSAELMARLDRGDLDAVVISEPKPVPNSLKWSEVAHEPLVVIAPADCQLDDYRSVLAAKPFIRFSRNAWVGHSIQRTLDDLGVSVTERMELDSLDVIRQMVRHGLGVSVVPAPAVDAFQSEGIRVLPFGDPPAHRAIGMLERQEHVKMGLTAALCRELIAASVDVTSGID